MSSTDGGAIAESNGDVLIYSSKPLNGGLFAHGGTRSPFASSVIGSDFDPNGEEGKTYSEIRSYEAERTVITGLRTYMRTPSSSSMRPSTP